jgi:hypothetical protein
VHARVAAEGPPRRRHRRAAPPAHRVPAFIPFGFPPLIRGHDARPPGAHGRDIGPPGGNL